MTIDQRELTAAVEELFGKQIAEIKAGLAAGGIAVKRDATRRLLAYARAKLAAVTASYENEISRLRTLHVTPVQSAQHLAEQLARQQVATLEAALADLIGDQDASLPTAKQIDAAIVPFEAVK